MAGHPKQATSIVVTICAHGTLRLSLQDRSGATFAQAAIAESNLADFVEDVLAKVEAYVEHARASGATVPGARH